eukprot:7985367-Prorocentrum_lima.AAC.1
MPPLIASGVPLDQHGQLPFLALSNGPGLLHAGSLIPGHQYNPARPAVKELLELSCHHCIPLT